MNQSSPVDQASLVLSSNFNVTLHNKTKTKRTEETSRSDNSKLVFVAVQSSTSRLLGSRGESGGRGDKGGKDSGLHGDGDVI